MNYPLQCWAFGRPICENKIIENWPFTDFKYLGKNQLYGSSYIVVVYICILPYNVLLHKVSHVYIVNIDYLKLIIALFYNISYNRSSWQQKFLWNPWLIKRIPMIYFRTLSLLASWINVQLYMYVALGC